MRKVFIFLFLLISNLVLGQKNFVDGYIILQNQSDTIKGKIDDKNWGLNPNKIMFIAQHQEEKRYDIQLLKAFGVSQKEHYIVKKVNLDVTPFAPTELTSNANLNIIKDTTLALLALLKADNSLYFFKDATSKEHYYFSNFKETTELINHHYLGVRNDKTYIIEDNLFQKQLDTLFQVCNKKLTTKNIEYSSESLIKVFTEFNTCMGCSSTCYFKKKEDKNSIKFSFLAAMVSAKLSQYYNDPVAGIEKNNNFFRFHPTFGLGISIYSKRYRAQKSLSFEALYEPAVISSPSSEFKLALNYLNINAIARRKILTKTLSPFYGGGIGIKNLLSSQMTSASAGFQLDTPKMIPKIILEAGLSISNLQIFTRINLDPIDKSYTFYKVNYIIEKINFGRFSSAIFVSYQF